MTASVPLRAPARPPLTGQSTAVIFFSARPWATAVATRGPVVETSMKVLTLLPWISPPSPRVAFWTMAGVGRLAKTISAASPTAAGDAAALAPRAVRASTAAALVSKTVRLWPASSSRPAIKPPMRPTPMNPR